MTIVVTVLTHAIYEISCRIPITALETSTQGVGFAVVLFQLKLLHWGMLCKVSRDHTGSYILLQQNITLILASVLQV